jgi:KDO2-lipid IV(A) lauroyltransferase
VKHRSHTTRQLLHPRNWPSWLGLGLLWIIIHLPYRAQLKLGAGLGALIYHTSRKRRHICETNIDLCFPEFSPAERHRLVREVFCSMGISLLETPLAWWGSDKRLSKLCHIEGIEHLQKALAEGHGALLLTAHFTCLELGARMLSLQHPFAVMYRQHRNLPFEAMMQENIERHFHSAISRHDVRSLIRALKKNQAVWYSPDQDFGPKHSLFAPFMGIQAATLEAPMRLSKMSGARVVPFFPVRREDGSGYQITVLPALENFPSGDDLQDATRINQLFEKQIRKAPGQYLWLHRRFKTRPPGEPGLYGWADKKRKRPVQNNNGATS